MNFNYEELKAKLQTYNQEHLLKFYDTLNEEKKEELLKEIAEIKFEEINNLYKNIGKEIKNNEDEITPIEYVDKSNLNEDEKQKYFSLGGEAIKQNKLAVVTMAGGQGTRLRT